MQKKEATLNETRNKYSEIKDEAVKISRKCGIIRQFSSKRTNTRGKNHILMNFVLILDFRMPKVNMQS